MSWAALPCRPLCYIVLSFITQWEKKEKRVKEIATFLLIFSDYTGTVN